MKSTFQSKSWKFTTAKFLWKAAAIAKVSPISEDLVAIKVDTSAGAVLKLGGQCYDGRRDAIDNFHSVGHVALCERDRSRLKFISDKLFNSTEIQKISFNLDD